MTAGSFCQRVSHFVPLLSQMPLFFLQLFSEHWVLWSFYILTFISLLFFSVCSQRESFFMTVIMTLQPKLYVQMLIVVPVAKLVEGGTYRKNVS